MKHIIILLIILLFIGIYFLVTEINVEKQITLTHQCVIPNSKYPEIQEIVSNRQIIFRELVHILKTDRWSVWGKSYDKQDIKNVPRFSDLSTEEKMKHLDSEKGPVSDGNAWRLYGLILEQRPFEHNIKECPETYRLIRNIPGLINAGFSCLEPNSKTPYHNDCDKRFYRVHVPLIVPKGDVRLDVFGDNRKKITLDWNRDFFVFDDTCYHQAFNNTDQHRIVLLLDIARR